MVGGYVVDAIPSTTRYTFLQSIEKLTTKPLTASPFHLKDQSMANILELEKVRDLINEYPENFDYEFTIRRRRNTPIYGYSPEYEDILKHGCNTCGCVIGYTLCSIPDNEIWDDVIQHASNILDLTYSERRFLFLGAKTYTGDGDARYLQLYEFPDDFSIDKCSPEEGRVEALKRLNFMIYYYRNIPNDEFMAP